MKIVLYFDLKKGDRAVADGEIEFISKRGADLTQLFDESRDSISYQETLKRIGLDCGKEYSIANVELRLMQGTKILKHKALADKIEEAEK